MISNSLSRVLVPVTRNLVQKRMNSVVSGPPTVHVSYAEKAILGTVMISSMLVCPVWILANLKHYKSK